MKKEAKTFTSAVAGPVPNSQLEDGCQPIILQLAQAAYVHYKTDQMSNSANNSGDPAHYRVDMAGYKVIGWMSLIVPASFAALCYHTHQFHPMWAFIGFASIGILMIAVCGHYELDEESLVHICAIGTYEILWRDIRAMEQAPGVLLLIGDKSRFVLPIGMWSGPQKHPAWKPITASALLRKP